MAFDLRALRYHERIALRDGVCHAVFDLDDEKENYRQQGQMLARLGFDEHDAHYPDDTWVGTLRLEGFRKQHKAKV